MRYLFGLLCVCALGMMPLVGCSETTGDGGSGGTAGDGGSGGMPECQSPEDCNDANDCTEGTCADGMCEYTPLADGTTCDQSNECTTGMCASGECDTTPVADDTACGDDAGTCQQGSCRVACTEQGIRDSIAAGGGPYTFECAGPQTVVTAAEIVIDNDVILDGESKLTVDGGGDHADELDDHGVFSVAEGVTAELRGFTVTGGRKTGDPKGGNGGGGIYNLGVLTVTNSTVSGNATLFGGGGIENFRGTLTVTNSTVSGNTGLLGEGIGVLGGTATVTNSTVSGNMV